MEKEKEGELNEMRENAGLETKPIYEKDAELKDFLSKAGL